MKQNTSSKENRTILVFLETKFTFIGLILGGWTSDRDRLFSRLVSKMSKLGKGRKKNLVDIFFLIAVKMHYPVFQFRKIPVRVNTRTLKDHEYVAYILRNRDYELNTHLN